MSTRTPFGRNINNTRDIFDNFNKSDQTILFDFYQKIQKPKTHEQIQEIIDKYNTKPQELISKLESKYKYDKQLLINAGIIQPSTSYTTNIPFLQQGKSTTQEFPVSSNQFGKNRIGSLFTPLNNSIRIADNSTKLSVTDLNDVPQMDVDSNLHRYKTSRPLSSEIVQSHKDSPDNKRTRKLQELSNNMKSSSSSPPLLIKIPKTAWEKVRSLKYSPDNKRTRKSLEAISESSPLHIDTAASMSTPTKDNIQFEAPPTESKRANVMKEYIDRTEENINRLEKCFELVPPENIVDIDKNENDKFVDVPTDQSVFKFHFNKINPEDGDEDAMVHIQRKIKCMEEIGLIVDVEKETAIYGRRNDGIRECTIQLEQLQFMHKFEKEGCHISGLLISGDLTISGILCDLIVIVHKLSTFNEAGITQLLGYADDIFNSQSEKKSEIPAERTSTRKQKSVLQPYMNAYNRFCKNYKDNENNLSQLTRNDFTQPWMINLVNSLIDMLSMYPDLIRILYIEFDPIASTSRTFHIGHIQFIYELSMKYLILKSLLDVNTSLQVIPALDDGQRIAFVTYDFCGAANAAKSGIPTVTSISIKGPNKFMLCSREILILLLPFYYDKIQSFLSRIINQQLEICKNIFETEMQKKGKLDLLHGLVLSPNQLMAIYSGFPPLRRFDLKKNSEDCQDLFEIFDILNTHHKDIIKNILSLEIVFLIDTDVLFNCSTVMFLFKMYVNETLMHYDNHALLLHSEDWRGHDYDKLPNIKTANEFTNKLHLICFFLKQKFPDMFYYIEYDINLKYYVLDFLKFLQDNSNEHPEYNITEELYYFLYKKHHLLEQEYIEMKKSDSLSTLASKSQKKNTTKQTESIKWFDGFSPEIQKYQKKIHELSASDYEKKLLESEIFESCCLAYKIPDIISETDTRKNVVNKFQLTSYYTLDKPRTQMEWFTLQDIVHTTDLGHFKLFTKHSGKIDSTYVDAEIRGAITEADGSANVKSIYTHIIEDNRPVDLCVAGTKIGTIYHSLPRMSGERYESRIILYEMSENALSRTIKQQSSLTAGNIYYIIASFNAEVVKKIFKTKLYDDFVESIISKLENYEKILEGSSSSTSSNELTVFQNIKFVILDNLGKILNELSIIFSTDKSTDIDDNVLSAIQQLLKRETSLPDKQTETGRTKRCIQYLNEHFSIMYRNISTYIDNIHTSIDQLPDKDSELGKLCFTTEHYIINFIDGTLTRVMNNCYIQAVSSIKGGKSLKHLFADNYSGKLLPNKIHWYNNHSIDQIIQKNRTKKISHYYKDVRNRNATKNISKNGLYHKRHRSRMVRKKDPKFLHFLKKTRKQKRNL